MKNYLENYRERLEELCEDIKTNDYDEKQVDELEEMIKFIFMYLENNDKRIKKLENDKRYLQAIFFIFLIKKPLLETHCKTKLFLIKKSLLINGHSYLKQLILNFECLIFLLDQEELFKTLFVRNLRFKRFNFL